jgi:hypothetical protein
MRYAVWLKPITRPSLTQSRAWSRPGSPATAPTPELKVLVWQHSTARQLPVSTRAAKPSGHSRRHTCGPKPNVRRHLGIAKSVFRLETGLPKDRTHLF